MLVYLREAHPADGWKIGDWSLVKDPTSQEERNQVAVQCCQALDFEFTTLVDTMDDHTAILWAAWPERIFVIDTDGTIVYAGDQGPWGFWPTDKFKGKVPPDVGPKTNLDDKSLEAFLEGFLGKAGGS